jgi:hypothetical protein
MNYFKKILIIFGLFAILVFALFSTTDFKQSIVVIQYNLTKQPIKLIPNKYKDRYCNMTIKDLSYSAQAILPNNDTLFFDDVGCMVLWLDTQTNKNNIILFVWAKDTNKYIKAKKAWYSSDELTPMGYGFAGYQNKKDTYLDFDTARKNILKIAGKDNGNH